MKKSYSKYLFEFIIIVFGISVSFQFDKYSEEVEKEKLKNHSLNRILKNIQQDIADHTLNINIHQDGVTSIEWVLDNYENTGIDRAEIGRELTSAILMNTILVDNQEEYRSLQKAMGHSSINVSLTYLRGLEIPELNEEDMPMI